jgi:hypothetical protein
VVELRLVARRGGILYHAELARALRVADDPHLLLSLRRRTLVQQHTVPAPICAEFVFGAGRMTWRFAHDLILDRRRISYKHTVIGN